MSALGNGALSALNLRLDIHKNVYNNIHLLMASNSLLLWRASGLVMYLLVVCLYISLSSLSFSPSHQFHSMLLAAGAATNLSFFFLFFCRCFVSSSCQPVNGTANIETENLITLNK